MTSNGRQTSSSKLRSRNEVTALLLAWRNGNEHALEQLTPLVYSELRKIARAYVARARRDLTLQPTALINEAYVRLLDMRQPEWQNRAHFYALAAQMMRRILVDFARARGYQKRGGVRAAVTLAEGLVSSERHRDLVALDEALKALALIDHRKSRIVELRFFGGLNAEETAEVLQVSSKTVLREWQTAKVWLIRELTESDTRHDGQ